MAASEIPSDDSFSCLFSGSDDSRENLFSSGSQDRSSVGSIPWAEDAVKQNALLWEQIERMFYGEEELPEEPELRNEIMDWQKAFPHLRVVGKKIEIPENISSTSTREEVEEIIAIDPPPIPIRRRHTSNKAFRVLVKEPEEASGSGDVTKMFAKDLRISSVPMLSRRRQMNESCSKEVPANKKTSAKRKEFLPPTVNANSVTYSSKSTNTPHSSIGRHTHPYAASAKTFRMPPISSYSMYPEKIDPDEVFKRPAEVPSKQSDDHVILPTLNVEEKDFIGDSVGRSISAAYNKRIKSSFLPNSASKLKSLK